MENINIISQKLSKIESKLDKLTKLETKIDILIKLCTLISSKSIIKEIENKYNKMTGLKENL